MGDVSAAASLAPSEGERVRVRGLLEGLKVASRDIRAVLPPHLGPLPLRGGEGEALRTAGAIFFGLSPIPKCREHKPD